MDICCGRVKTLADLKNVTCLPYFYIEDTSASTTGAAKIIEDLADKVHADCIVAAKSNKVMSLPSHATVA